MDFINSLFGMGTTSVVLLGAFFIAFIGYALGSIQVKGVSLGTAGVFLMALLCGYLFTQPTTGKPHTETSMKQMWRSFKQALDLDMGAQMVRGAIDPATSVVADDLTPYCLRHTYATDLQSAGVPINVAKDFLGHKSITMTSHIYTHLSDEAFTNASLKVLSFATESRKKAQKKVVSIR